MPNDYYKKKAEQRKLIQKLKRAVKKEKAFVDKCKEYDKTTDFVDDVHISFKPLDVSAKTVDGKIYLNEKLIDEDWDHQMRYMVHELTHVLQQAAGMVNSKVDEDSYLDDDNEQEAFCVQINYMDEHNTAEELQEYIEQLLNHHDIKGKERKEKVKELTKDL